MKNSIWTRADLRFLTQVTHILECPDVELRMSAIPIKYSHRMKIVLVDVKHNIEVTGMCDPHSRRVTIVQIVREYNSRRKETVCGGCGHVEYKL